jgi:hypothetical protein
MCDVALLQVDDLVGDAGQCHRVGGEKVLVRSRDGADAEHERRALPRADHAVRLVAAEHGDRIGTAQPRQRALDGLEEIAVVAMIHEMGDDLGVGLGDEGVALGLQLGAQLVVVLDDAVVHDADAPGGGDARGLAGIVDGALAAARRHVRAVREVRMRVVHDRCTVRRPARVRDAGAAFEMVGGDVGGELGDARRAAGAAQLAVLMERDAARVVAPVFEPAQALDQHRDDVSRADGGDDSAHDSNPRR